MPRNATIGDVAKLAGVSVATVSRVMNGSAPVLPDTLDRVQRAATELNYQPSTTARSLSLGQTKAVSLLVPDLSNPMFQEVLRGAQRAAAAAGYRLVVSDSGENPDGEAELARESRRHSDGLILCAPRMPQQQLDEVIAACAPVVLINREPDGVPAAALVADYWSGIRMLARRLMRLGHRSICYLAGPEASTSNSDRRAALAAFAVENPEVAFTEVACGAALQDGYRAMPDVLATGATAVIAFNDVVAMGLLGRLAETGISVPDDISVTGYDDIAMARYGAPPLTTVSVPYEALGRQAWEELEQRLTQSEPETASVLRFPPRLIERSSIGPVPRSAPPAAPEHVNEVGLSWRRDDDDVAVDLIHNGAMLTQYQRRPAMPTAYSPRPFLHPITTMAGTVLTAANSRIIRHQHGLSVALPWVDGTNYWGGRTYVEGRGPVPLDNHGRQSSVELTVTGAQLRERLNWRRADDSLHLRELREIDAQVRADDDGWQFRWRSTLTAMGDTEIHSPAIDGRANARYGGIFWRFPDPTGVNIACADGIGGPAAQGSRSPWLTVSRPDGDKVWTALLIQREQRVPWHVRAENYVAVGPAVAWDGPIHLAEGEDLVMSLDVVLLDRVPTRTEITAIVENP